MTYQEFAALAKAKGWTLAQLRCDVMPTKELLAAIDRCRLDRWERYTLLWERREAAARAD